MKQYKNILVNALVNLGDVVLTTSAIALLRKAYPEAKITMMVKPVVRQAVENNPLIDDVIVFQYKAKGNSFGKMLGMVKDIKRRHFDLSVSFDRKLRPALHRSQRGLRHWPAGRRWQQHFRVRRPF